MKDKQVAPSFNSLYIMHAAEDLWKFQLNSIMYSSGVPRVFPSETPDLFQCNHTPRHFILTIIPSTGLPVIRMVCKAKFSIFKVCFLERKLHKLTEYNSDLTLNRPLPSTTG